MTHSTRTTLCRNALLLLATGFSAALAAQDEPGRPPLPATVFDGVGLHVDGDLLVGGGPDYAVEFRADGTTVYRAAFGDAAERTLPLQLRLQSVARGGEVWQAATPSRHQDGLTACFARPGVTERYEITAAGVEQSFVLERLPGNGGDLIVRLAVTTELVPEPGDTDEPVRFGHPGAGWVGLGAVTGIDALGARSAGSMQLDGNILELRLPAAFVDGAALPLVLDPLIGTTILAGANNQNHRSPDLAYDSTNDKWLLAWSTVLSSTDHDVRCRRINGDGTSASNTLFAATGTTGDGFPVVANVPAEDVFVIAWQRFQTATTPSFIRGRAAGAASGFGTITDLVNTTNDFGPPDIGTYTGTLSKVMLAFENITQDSIRVNPIDVSGLTLTPQTPTFGLSLFTSSSSQHSVSRPAIARAGTPLGRFLVVWQNTETASNRTRVQGAIVEHLNVLQTPFWISDQFAYDNDAPDVDGNGNDWVVAWARSEDMAGTETDDDVVCRGVRYTRSQPSGSRGYVSTPIRLIEWHAGQDEQGAVVAWVGSSVLLAYQQTINGRWDVSVRTLDPTSCELCEAGPFPVLTGNHGELTPAVAATFSGSYDASDDDAMIAFVRIENGTTDGDVVAQRFETEDGRAVAVGGQCGEWGDARSYCARQGNGNFAFMLRDSNPSSTAIFVLSPDRADLRCGTCTLVPDPFAGFVFTATTDAVGDATVPLALPSNPAITGLFLWSQWLEVVPSNQGCAHLGVDFGTSWRVTIH